MTSLILYMESIFGNTVRALRKENGLMQREVAAYLGIDSPMLSNIERGERKARREHVSLFAELFNADQDQLLTAWLADKIQDIIQDEKVAQQTIRLLAKHMDIDLK